MMYTRGQFAIIGKVGRKALGIIGVVAVIMALVVGYKDERI